MATVAGALTMPRSATGVLRRIAVLGCLLLIEGGRPPTAEWKLPEPADSVPHWARKWSRGPKAPCRRHRQAPAVGTVATGAWTERDTRAAVARIDSSAARGFQCSAADELLALSAHVEGRQTGLARESLERALRLALAGDDATLLARVVQKLASLESNEQNARRAWELSLASCFLWQQTGDFEAWAASRFNLGVLLFWMGRIDEAEELLRQLLLSLEVRGRCCRPVIASTLTILGRIDIAQGDLDGAEGLLARALEARARAGDQAVASTLDAICRLRIEQRDFRRAASLNQQVLSLVGGSLRSEANALATKAEIAVGLGRPAAALDLARRSRRLIADSGGQDPNLDLHSHFVEATAQRALGRAALADASMEALMARLEAYRQAGQGSLVVPFFAARRLYVAAWVADLLARGRAVEAFEISEWTRARGLLDRLVWPPVAMRERASPAQLQEDQRLRQEIAALGAQVEELAAGDRATAVELGSQARSLRLSLLALEAEMRPTSIAVAARPIGLREAQALIDDDTLVLCYWLGEEHSVVWALEPRRSWVAAGLPARHVLDRAAIRLRDLIAKGEGADHETRAELQALGDALLAPVAAQLRTARSIVVVPDSELGEVPFAALPLPARGGEEPRRLVDHAPVTVVHSLSVLAAIRGHAEERRRRQELVLAAMVDPVYGPADSRFPRSRRGRALLTPARRRLGESGREVSGVVARLGRSRARLWRGLDASRQHVLAGWLDRTRFVHLGAHADLHRADPELSAIYLSAVDREGSAVDGALRLQDLERVRLAAEVVALAGCRTGGGRNYLGEGPLALPRGFMLAGAASVVATLWRVGDEPTASFFERFWMGVVDRGLPPAQALREAQLALAHSGRWQHPRHWAGFVLLGEWAG
jgi:CHAT domain-containing protein